MLPNSLILTTSLSNSSRESWESTELINSLEPTSTQLTDNTIPFMLNWETCLILLYIEANISLTVIVVFLETTSSEMKFLLIKCYSCHNSSYLNTLHILTQLKFLELEIEFSMNSLNYKILIYYLKILLNKLHTLEEESQDQNLLKDILALMLEFCKELLPDGSGIKKFPLLPGDQFTI